MINQIHKYLQGILSGEKQFPFVKIGFSLAVLLSVLPTYHILKFSFTNINHLPQATYNFLDNHIPKDFEATIKNGQLTINQPEPFYLTINEQELTDFTKLITNNADTTVIPQTQTTVRILTVDTKADPDDFEKYQTLALVTQKNLVYQDDDGMRLQSFADIENFSINSEQIKQKIAFIKSPTFLFWIKIIAHTLPIMVFIGMSIGVFIGWLGTAIFFWVIAYVMSRKVPFSKIYAFSACLWTLPYLLSYLATSLSPNDITTAIISIVEIIWKIFIAMYAYHSLAKSKKI